MFEISRRRVVRAVQSMGGAQVLWHWQRQVIAARRVVVVVVVVAAVVVVFLSRDWSIGKQLKKKKQPKKKR